MSKARFAQLALDDAPRTLVFRAVEDLLRRDPTLKRIETTIRAWQGEPTDKELLSYDMAPGIILTPYPGPETYWYSNTMKGKLFIQFETITAGLCVDDAENLSYAIERVLIPHGTAAQVQATIAKLTTAGAVTGQVTFSTPIFDPRPDLGSDGAFRGIGRCELEVKTSM